MIAALLATAVAVEIFCAIAFAAVRSTLDRLHYVSLAALTGPLLILAAIALQEGWSKNLPEAVLTILIVAASSPVTAHVIGSAAYRLEVLQRSDGEEESEERA
ncbi:MAG TPA: monovalent cation/H(+) antiporter subunit G [Thermoanaerobaculia bacterium]|nr:monovalent cation/H(+) antiporter subunit G [Thermoanaerobaculia bacterium]